jgi:dimeric dUTPase (all-alpha-NTP-PPase superfamily)
MLKGSFTGGGTMNAQKLTELFPIQAKLDQKILTKHPLEEGEDRLEKVYTALLVELGEAMNEYRAFKFWSTDKVTRKKKLLEELVDCLHFILSIGLRLRYEDNVVLYSLGKDERTIECAFIEVVTNDWLEYYEHGFCLYISFCELLGFTTEDLYNAYFEKNVINHKRQEEGY